MERSIILILVLLGTALLSTNILSKPSFYSDITIYLNDGSVYCGYVVITKYLMYNENDTVYITIKIVPYMNLYISSLTIKIGDYEDTILRNTVIEEDYAKTISIPHDLLHYGANSFQLSMKWKPKGYYISTSRYNYLEVYTYGFIIYGMSYYDLANKYVKLYRNYTSLECKYDNLKWNYNCMVKKYDSVKKSYEELEEKYNKLNEKYSSLLSEYEWTESYASKMSVLCAIFFLITIISVPASFYYARKYKSLKQKISKEEIGKN